MPNIPKKPNQDVLDIIDRDILYFPVSGRLVWLNSRPKLRAKIGDEIHHIHCGYKFVTILNVTVSCHHVAWYKFYSYWPEQQLDHRDENKLNNAIKNLREVNHNQNRWNISTAFKNNKLGIKGIRYLGNNYPKQYFLRVMTNGVTIAKTFATLEQAIEARNEHYKNRPSS